MSGQSPDAGPDIPQISLRILVVDDHPDSAASLAMLLSLTGSEVRTAQDGAPPDRFQPGTSSYCPRP